MRVIGRSAERGSIHVFRHSAMTYRARMRPLALAPLLLAAALLTAAPAAADDPHEPNMGAGYCPGGGTGAPGYLAYCDGVPFADGTKWHIIQYGTPLVGHPNGLLSPGRQCVNGDGSPAGPGGCGGAVH